MLEALSEFGKDAVEAELPSETAQARSPREIWLNAVNDLAQRTVRLERQSVRVREGLERLIESLAAEAERGAVSVDPDEVIESLRESEQGIKADLFPTLRQMKSTRQGTFSLPNTSSAERARAIAASDRYTKAVTDMLELLRDARWRIMALRAEHEDPGDAPVFDNSQALLQYLDKKTQ